MTHPQEKCCFKCYTENGQFSTKCINNTCPCHQQSEKGEKYESNYIGNGTGIYRAKQQEKGKHTCCRQFFTRGIKFPCCEGCCSCTKASPYSPSEAEKCIFASTPQENHDGCTGFPISSGVGGCADLSCPHQQTEEWEEKRKQLHLKALAKAENAKDIGDCTVVRLGYVTTLIMDELARERKEGYEAGIYFEQSLSDKTKIVQAKLEASAELKEKLIEDLEKLQKDYDNAYLEEAIDLVKNLKP